MNKYYIVKGDPRTFTMEVLKVIRADSIKEARKQAVREYTDIALSCNSHLAVFTRQRYLEAFDLGFFGSVGRNL